METINKEMKYERPVITSITMYNDGHNYVNYSDTDCQTDYFHGSRAGTVYTIEQLKKDAGQTVIIHPINNENSVKFDRRVARFVKAIGYTVEKRITKQHYVTNGIVKEWDEIEYIISDTFLGAQRQQ